MQNKTKMRLFAAACLAFASMPFARADIITASTIQVGGFYDGGGADNHIEHQNYFVGYGTVGASRTPERRSFFWYHIPEFAGVVTDVSIKLKMLFTTSIIFGLDPGDPMLHDTMESFQLGATGIAPLHIVDPDLTLAEGQDIFDDLAAHPVATPFDFEFGHLPPIPFDVVIHLDAFGKMIVGSHHGADVVLTGSMPTWSEDLRTDGMGHFLEADELLFGFSDVPTLVPAPELTITYTPVPEPCTLVAVLFGAGLAFRRNKKRVKPSA